jgi:hypothetical protein
MPYSNEPKPIGAKYAATLGAWSANRKPSVNRPVFNVAEIIARPVGTPGAVYLRTQAGEWVRRLPNDTRRSRVSTTCGMSSYPSNKREAA